MQQLPADLPSPCFVVDETAVERNMRVMQRVQRDSGGKILLALKGFAMWSLFPMMNRYLAGTTASGLHEAMLGHRKFGGEVHVYCPAFGERDFEQVMQIADHVIFNSFSQWHRFRDRVRDAPRHVKAGLRINPEHSEVETALYDPCAPCSRLGMTLDNFEAHADDTAGLHGIHFHTLCELGSDALERTLAVVERKFGKHFDAMPDLKWINMGGGHHITRPGYNVDHLVQLISDVRSRHDVDVYLEPGEACGLNCGILMTTVLDLFESGGKRIAILDTSASAHMPDVLEMPYRPKIVAVAGDDLVGEEPDALPHTYRLGGLTCLAGDVIGDYSFHRPLKVGDRVIFDDMGHYSMVKTTTFNGVPLPSIAVHNSETGDTRVVRQFGFEDYAMRLS